MLSSYRAPLCAAMAAVGLSSLGKQVRNEVYDFDNVDLIVSKAETLFSLLNITPPNSFDN